MVKVLKLKIKFHFLENAKKKKRNTFHSSSEFVQLVKIKTTVGATNCTA